jgi:predicted Zn-dependent peptidase
MPRVIDCTPINLVLASDQQKPAEKQVIFAFCYLPARKYRRLQALIDQAIAAAEAGNAEQEDAAVDEALLSGITALENSPVGAEELVKDYLTAEERWELLIRWRKEMNREPEPAPAANGQSESTPPATLPEKQ